MSAASAAFSTATYCYFVACFIAHWAFLIPTDVLVAYLPSALSAAVPYSMEACAQEPNGLLWDLALIAMFALPHSVLARNSIKEALGLPTAWERSFYVLQSTVLLHLQMALWKNFDGPTLWDFSANTTMSAITYALFACGLLWQLTSTFALDHFQLFGLTQAFGVDINAMLGLAPTFTRGVVVRAHYAIVAHPIMTGMMIGCWATPVLSAPRLLFAVANTTYMVIAVKGFEEPQLDASIGPAYGEYLSTVPSFCPMFPMKARATKAAGSKGL
jgi:protein-S-isoprenylcysteine O-methyltransferase Ste14